MAKFIPYDYNQSSMVVINFSDQIQTGTFEHAVHHLVEAYQEFATAINNYANKKEKPTLEDFFLISTKGELYFDRMRISCDAIIAEKLDNNSIKNSILPKVKEAVERTLPDFYETLTDIAEKENIKYVGELRRNNYESIYTVYETHEVN